MNNSNKQIIECLDSWLNQNHKLEVNAVQAAEILDKAGLLRDSKSRPGQPLRKKLRNHDLPHAYQNGVNWYIPKSNGLRKIVVEDNSKAISSCPQNKNDKKYKQLSHFEASILLDKEIFKTVAVLTENEIPDTSGLYAIRIQNINILPKEYRNELVKRNDTLLYIGKAENLRIRLWGEELHAQKPATFFRTIGAVLGFRPPKGSLSGKSNPYNYRFSSDDNTAIIEWIKDNLLVHFVEFKDNIHDVEKKMIKEVKPIMNIQNNPQALQLLKDSRKECRDIANS